MHRACAAWFAVAAAVSAQGTDKPPVPESDGAQAHRLTRLLELPERCTESWRGLLALREAAAPPLALTLQDPRPDVAVRAAWVLGLLGRDAEMALPALQRGSKGKEPRIACACRWAIDRVVFRGTLLTDYQDGSVVLLDEQGKERRRIGKLNGPWHAEPAGGGNLLISEYGGNRVREIDAQDKEVWSFPELSNPYHAQRLPDGNTLISDAGHGRVVEVDPGGKVVWELKNLKRPVAAERLPDGHMLITEQEGRVHEIDGDGRVVLEIKALQSPQWAQRLSDGHTLIAVFRADEVLEVDATGKAVGEPFKVTHPQMALRRSDGHTLIAATGCWLELDAAGQEVWRQPGKYAVGILRP
jgi:hypothetical protein